MKKRKIQEDRKNNNRQHYSVSEKQEVYLCANATNKEHNCKFGLCRDCYLKHEPSRKTRTRKSPEKDDSMCTHKCYTSLQQFFDKQFFTSKYMEQTQNRGIAWTSHCDECGVKFVSMGRNGKIN